ncbi:uncharacterized protein MELLADRAFT_104756 [Melampsora larici-populina 98AG31]|uniref:Uncharacterized protein n=1 Tax=Melampsora larici-populina (strain 98AG31 / pathotype 3-4-7) TaxID=747676 RepID=F4RFT3_MELLP|nr:uncharacterized protein MELLADRAFT_104756 [Melampsora larici-populina 98AG31]EGG08874.1 hypothetical protein MELLADRAFT_104756 [Melampsora larici-populina 98AG31]
MGCCARFQRSFSALYHWIKNIFKSTLGVSNWHKESFKFYGSKDIVEEARKDEPITPIYFASSTVNVNINGSQQSHTSLPVSRKPPPGIATARVSRLRFDSNGTDNHDRHRVNLRPDSLSSHLRVSSTTYSDLDAYTVWDSASDESVPLGQLSFSGPILPYFSSPLPPLSSSSKSFLTDLKDLDPRLREATVTRR